ncbi:ribosome biogenesis protein C1orf109 homolog isoform X2 [Myxocyprinus asiaticus]|uniref:ribosome biogenesis protein C1orf109 homolog isoform X2 n=1 Tax=Myxocyprinus asiaticus TaxID=70543 RepID=UPI00222398AE|nr:ribosome biogenesis protein C1orf109 homolog isoform X2 [Myxocyprinus asiaticus]
MSNPVLVSLHQQLKKCFEVLKVNKNVWESVLAECIPLMSSLGNLAVQLKALKNVQLANTPLAKFPSLQERLHYKLSLAVDTVLGKLAEKMDALQTISHLSLHRRHVRVASRRRLLLPPPRRKLLWMLKPTDLTLMETEPKRWESLHSSSREERIADALCQVSFFMDIE